jgi:hypothetical protein
MPAEVPDNTIPISPALSLTSEALLAELECWRELVAGHFIKIQSAIAFTDFNKYFVSNHNTHLNGSA